MSPLPPSRSASSRAVRRILGREGRLRSGIERRFAGRRARRRLVVAWAAVIVVTAVVTLVVRLQDALGPALFVGGVELRLVAQAAPGFVLAVALGWMVRTAVRGVADLPDEDIDEREVALRDRAYVVAYRVLVATVAFLLATAYIVADASSTQAVAASVAGWVLSDALFVFIPLVGFLPSSVLAWYSDEGVEDEVTLELQGDTEVGE